MRVNDGDDGDDNVVFGGDGFDGVMVCVNSDGEPHNGGGDVEACGNNDDDDDDDDDDDGVIKLYKSNGDDVGNENGGN